MKPIKPPKELAGDKKLGTKNKDLDHKLVSKKKDDLLTTKRRSSTIPKLDRVDDDKKKEPPEKSKCKKIPAVGKKPDAKTKTSKPKEEKPKEIKVPKPVEKTKGIKKGLKETEDIAAKQKSTGASKGDGKGRRKSSVGQDKIKLLVGLQQNKPAPKVVKAKPSEAEKPRVSDVGGPKVSDVGRRRASDIGKLKVSDIGKPKVTDVKKPLKVLDDKHLKPPNMKDFSLKIGKTAKQNPPSKRKGSLQGPEKSWKPLKTNALSQQNKATKSVPPNKSIKGSLQNKDDEVKKPVDLIGLESDEDDDTFSKQLTINITDREDYTARDNKENDQDNNEDKEGTVSGTKQSSSSHSFSLQLSHGSKDSSSKVKQSNHEETIQIIGDTKDTETNSIKQSNEMKKLSDTSSKHGSKRDDATSSGHSNAGSELLHCTSKFCDVGMQPGNNTSKHSNVGSRLDDLYTSSRHSNMGNKLGDNISSRHSNIGSKRGDNTSSKHSNTGSKQGDYTSSKNSNAGSKQGDYTSSKHSNAGSKQGDYTSSKHSNAGSKQGDYTSSKNSNAGSKHGDYTSSRHSNAGSKHSDYTNSKHRVDNYSSKHSSGTKTGDYNSRHSDHSDRIVGHISEHGDPSQPEAMQLVGHEVKEVDEHSNSGDRLYEDSKVHVNVLGSDSDNHNTEQNSVKSKEEPDEKKSVNKEDHEGTYDSESDEDEAARTAQDNDSQSSASENEEKYTQDSGNESDAAESKIKHTISSMHYDEDFQDDLDNASRDKDHNIFDKHDSSEAKDGGGGEPYHIVIADASEESL